MTKNAAGGASEKHEPVTDYRPVDNPAVTRPIGSTRIARSDASALADLQVHWGSAYEIGLDGDIWSATFRGTSDELRAHTCLELRALIRADYAYRQQAGTTRPRFGTAGLPDGCGDQAHQETGSAGDTGAIHGERMSL